MPRIELSRDEGNPRTPPPQKSGRIELTPPTNVAAQKPREEGPTTEDVEANLLPGTTAQEREFLFSMGEIIKDPKVQRALLEVGVSIPAVFLAPQIGIPKVALGTLQLGRTVMGAARGINLGSRATAAGAGMAAGSLIAETIDPSKRPFKEAGDAFFVGAASEVGATAILTVAKKVGAPLVKKLEKGAEKAIKTAQQLGATVLPGQATRSRIVDLLQNIAEASLLGGGRLAAVKEKSEEILQNAVENFAKKFVTTRLAVGAKEDIGDLMRLVIGESSDAFRAFTRAIAHRVDATSGGIRVDIRPQKEFAEKLIEQAKAGIKSASMLRIAKQVLDKDDFISFEVADILRSDLLAVGRLTTDLLPGRASGAAQKLAGILDGQIDKAGKILQREDAIQAWRMRNQAVREGKTTFNSRFMRSLMSKNADEIFGAVIKPGRPTRIRAVREIILGEVRAAKPAKLGEVTVKAKLPGDRELWRTIQGQYIDDLLLKNADDLGRISAESALKEMKRFGDPALKELFPGGGHETLRRYLRALAIVQRKPTQEGTGRIFIQLTQAGAALNLLMGGPFTGMSATVLLGPPVLARMFTSPRIARLLTVGLKAPLGSKEAVRISAQLLGAMDKEGLLPPDISLIRRGEQILDLLPSLKQNKN